VRRFFTLGWLGLHLLAIVLIGLFLLAGYWQFFRAEGGNIQSWAYVIEWPLFAGFVVVMWVRMVRDELHPQQAGVVAGGVDAVPGEALVAAAVAPVEFDDEPDDELAAYNRRLARLNDEPGRGRR
jgi:hypothetical protein